MMTTLRALVIAFSMYSQIPMPQFTWQDKEMKYAFCFFPRGQIDDVTKA